MDEQLRLGDSDALVSLKRAWTKSLKLLIPEINRPTFESVASTARPVSMEGGSVTIGVGSEFARIYIEKYSDMIRSALESVMGNDFELHFVIAPVQQTKSRSQEPRQVERKPTVGVASTISQPLNDKYIFENFVVGPCNKMAHGAAQAVAENPGKIYNPFFLYGGPGLGKTHLLQAIGHQILDSHPGVRIAYVSGETFTSHYVLACREHRSDEFRRKYRSVDVLLIDDIQFIAGKQGTKEEFFNTFNALYQMDKQIILCSDRPPRELHPLEERIKSRFECGLVVDITPPNLETRVAILQNKAKSEKVRMPIAVIKFVAEFLPTNIRALEGALITLIAYTSLMKADFSVELAQEVLGRYLSEKKLTDLNPETIQRAVAQTFDVEIDAIRGEKRQKDLVSARHIAMYLIREMTDYSLPAIGKSFGGRDHSTVVHACRRVKSLLEENPALKATIEELTQKLRTGDV